MNTWELTLENIGCFVGKHSFRFKSGTNIVTGPNASGKTSLLHAFQLLLPKESNDIAPYYLNSSCMTGMVQLRNGDEGYSAELTRTSNGSVRVRKKKLLTNNDQVNHLVFLSDNHQLMDAVIKGDVNILKNWFVQITELNYFEKAYAICSKLDSHYRNEKDKESKSLLAQRHQLRKEFKKLKLETKEKESKFSQFQLAGLSEEIDPIILDKFKSTSKKLEKSKKDLNKLNTKKVDLNSLIPALKEKKGRFEAELLKIGDEFSTAKERISKINEYIERNYNDISEQRKGLRKINSEITRREILITNYTSTLSSDSIECQHCGSILSKETLSHKLEKIQEELFHFSDEKGVINERVRELTVKNDTYQKELRNIRIGLPKEKKELKEGIQRLINEIGRKQKNLESNEERIDVLQKEFQKISQEYENLQDQILDLSEKKQEILNLEKEVKGELAQLEKQSNEIEEKLSKIKTQLSWLKIYDNRRQILKQISIFLHENIVSIQENVLDRINIHLDKMLSDLRIPLLRSIQFDDNFNMKITRSTGISGEFNELSGLERRLIALIVGYSVKNAFLEKFPLFIIDETLYNADDTSFQRIIDYIGQKVELLLVTRLGESHNLERDLIGQNNIIFWEDTQ